MDKRNFTTSWVNFGIILALAFSGFYMARGPLESSRPRLESNLTEDIPENKTVLRTWEDPFNCLEKVRLQQSKTGTLNPFPDEIDVERVFDDLANVGKDDQDIELLVEAVMVPGRNFEDRVERRVRSRVAVHAALSESGFVPFDSETLGYFTFRFNNLNPKQIRDNVIKKLCCSNHNSNATNQSQQAFGVNLGIENFTKVQGEIVQKTTEKKTNPQKQKNCSKCKRMLTSLPGRLNVPYEWFRLQSDNETKRVLVLWINEDEIADSPVHVLTSLKHQVNGTFAGIRKYCEEQKSTPDSQSSCSANSHQKQQTTSDENSKFGFHVIGPWHSSTLRTVCAELPPESDSSPSRPCCESLPFYNVVATSRGSVMEPSHIHRIVSSDDETAKVLVKELQRRIGKRIRGYPEPQFVLIAEHDTHYGRTLPKTFETALTKTFFKDDPRSTESLIARYTYLRGLDGTQVSDAGTGNSSNPKTPSPKGPGNFSNSTLPARPANRAFGNNQIDYIIRLTERIKQRNPNPRAIGILGSDTYDKLLLLNELKHHFPATIFFTTDLDAVLIDVQETKWTKNLLVAASHGLRLHESIQKNTPEFRSNYQTSMFQGVYASVEKRFDRDRTFTQDLNETSKPRIFEIGINRIHDLSSDFHVPGADIHPRAREFPSAYRIAATVLFFMIGISFLVLIFLCFGWSKLLFDLVTGKWIDEVCNPEHFGNSRDLKYLRNIFCFLGYCGKCLIIVTVVVLIFNHFLYDLGGEPFVWMDGVSVWPTVLIQLLALLLGWGFFVGAIHRMRKTRLEINNKLGTKQDTRPSVPHGKDVYNDARTLLSILKSKGYKALADHVWNGNDPETGNPGKNKKNDMESLWIQYRDVSRVKVRSMCIICFIPIFILSMIALASVSSWGSCRSLTVLGLETYSSFWIACAVWLVSWGILLFLSIFIAAENYSCSRFISKLIDAKFYGHTSKPLVSKDDYLQWRHITLIGYWTQENNHLMLQPALILFLLTIARSPVFDYFGSGLPCRTLVALVIFALIFVPMITLRRKAFQLKNEYVEHLRNMEIEAQGSKRKNRSSRIEQIQSVKEDLEHYSQGIYSSIILHPIFQAALIVTGGTTLPAFLEAITKG